jgi:hypothetical protein
LLPSPISTVQKPAWLQRVILEPLEQDRQPARDALIDPQFVDHEFPPHSSFRIAAKATSPESITIAQAKLPQTVGVDSGLAHSARPGMT